MNRFQNAGRKAVLGFSAVLLAGGMTAGAPSAIAATAPAGPQGARAAQAAAHPHPHAQQCRFFRVQVRRANVFESPSRRSGVVDRALFGERLRSARCFQAVRFYNRFEGRTYLGVRSFRADDRIGWVDVRTVRRAFR